MRIHPDAVLSQGEDTLPCIPVVDHYAGSENLMRKALAMQAAHAGNGMTSIDVTFDCEDGASVGAEEAHAELVAALIMTDENRFARVGTRIHDVTHASWLEDLQQIVTVAGTRLAYVTLPKARGVDDVRWVLSALRGIEQQCNLIRKIPLHVLIETHGALHQVWDIAALEGVASLDFGLMDFVSVHHGAIAGRAMQSPGQFDHAVLHRAKTEIVAAALAHAVVPTHNVTIELNDVAKIREDARRARQEFGFMRMWSIHPNQIEPILSAMQADYSELVEANEVISTAQDTAWGPIQLRDRLYDRASYRYYWNLLKRAHATGCELPSETRERFF
ncbi:MAG TPA: aldolase/citrate lyase family protein [Rhodocyclaceae bacterium]|nr:aldolase/citrate lyase family protein [Rhodocyclaceae bacterium]